tara:strand:+ start:94 stop:477 length:384 start_codon:yes stop_codon:yes gene_type:complete
MAHFAKVEDTIVTQVIVAEQDYIDTLPDKEKWVQTSYNTKGGKHYAPESAWQIEDDGTPIRYNYAGIGFTYDYGNDAFYAPQPYPSWTLNKTTFEWQAPIGYPNDGKDYIWNESSTSWKEITQTEFE